MPSILILGACGEIGSSLVAHLAESRAPGLRIVTVDRQPLTGELSSVVARHIVGDITNPSLLEDLFAKEGSFDTVFHLAALLSTTGEKNPLLAHTVNVEATLRLLQAVYRSAHEQGKRSVFVFPSTIAAYGVPSLTEKAAKPKAGESDFPSPITMYGANKRYAEMLGCYFADRIGSLTDEHVSCLDFRCLRLPGVICATTMPSGGTSDYLPEMLHAAAKGDPYTCFVRPDTTIPFMVMPDTVRALLELAAAPAPRLTQRVYNITAFSVSAGEFARQLSARFPKLKVSFEPHPIRQNIVDSWPAEVDDCAARNDWGWRAQYDLSRALDDYLIPSVYRHYYGAAAIPSVG